MSDWTAGGRKRGPAAAVHAGNVTMLYAEDAADSPGKAGVEMQVRRDVAHARCLLLQQRACHVTTRGAGFERGRRRAAFEAAAAEPHVPGGCAAAAEGA